MKSDHRHELKTNELADWMAHFPEWAKQNRTNLILVAVVIVAAVAVYFWSFYRRDVVSVRNQARLTSLVTQVPQQISSIARAAMQNTEQSYVLLPIAQDLQEFAQSTSNDDMAALALIERAEALRAELHYRLADVSREELTKQIDQARVSYQEALDREPSAALAAAAEFGLGLCEEELGMSEKATEIYRATAEKPEYAGTAAQEAAAYRLKIVDEYKGEVVFKPAPPPPAEMSKASAPTIQFGPGDANAPMVLQVPTDVNLGPAFPSDEADATPVPISVDAPDTSEANAPAGN